MKRRKHIRSNSCDVKIARSNSRDYDTDHRMRRQPNNSSHSRNNSRDLDLDFRQKLTHSRTNSRDDHSNIKYILNYLKPDHSKLFTAYGSDGGSTRATKKHSRNHSYDQIYNMPNNIKLDQELNKKFTKNRINETASVAEYDVNILQNKDYADSKLTGKIDPTTVVKMTHSRTNSKDLNTKGHLLATIVDDGTDSILRHRRTNSKDLNRVMNMSPSTSSLIENGAAAIASGSKQHVRNLSQPKVQVEQEILESAQLLLQQRNDARDSTEQNSNDTQQRL